MVEKPTKIHCSFKSEDLLYHAYMPFVKGGGLFIRSKQDYPLGSALTLEVQLLDESDTYTVDGTVVWITPKGAQANKPSGVGVQFTGENSRVLANKIETYLAGMLKSTQPTDTI